jgi:hypothetical protein
MTELSDRELLRLHIEAVWSTSLPPFDNTSVELSSVAKLPLWTLYLARLADDQVAIWRPDVALAQRDDLLDRASRAGVVYDASNGMRREVVLRHSGKLDTRGTASTPAARLLTMGDAALVEEFEAGSAAYFLDPLHAPCLGVVVDGHLVSVAHSSARTVAARELGINTLLEARQHGYAKAATSAWTDAVQREGLTPIYSAFAHNAASLRLAAACGYIRVSESVYVPVADDAG